MAPPSSLALQVSEAETIRLPGRGTVGYEWTAEIEGAEDVVEVSEVSPEVPAAPAPPGESLDQVFRVTARHPGRAVIHFEQRRPWEPEAAPLESYDVEVTIAD